MFRFYRRRQVRSFTQDASICSCLARHDAGLQTVPVDHIEGSVGRDRELLDDFLPARSRRSRRDMERYLTIRSFMEAERPLPPVRLYRLCGRYYVLDGNHRVAAARSLGQLDLDAEVVEYSACA